MGDADDSYDFADLRKFIEGLRSGADVVQGCRLPWGGGTVRPGACSKSFPAKQVRRAEYSLMHVAQKFVAVLGERHASDKAAGTMLRSLAAARRNWTSSSITAI